ncbi:MAG TPA: beta-N-acetylhexosaminidase [Candidatus Sulfotelmatobacter sp.]|nr:beta-N-acetylhexosaminidase [Candidatus Sulfotelmatobacter sp.]
MPNTDTLRRQVGQLLILGFDGLEIDSKLRTTLSTLQPSGVILFARNIEEPQQTWRLLRDAQASTRVPMFLCVDLEGGTVDRLKKVIAPAPSVEQVFATGNRKLFRMHGSILGLEARALGFNTDFAPVFDLGFEASRSVLTSRTASVDPKQTIAYAREFLKGLKAAKVLGCGKHFPGLGEGNLDSHHGMPVVQKSWKAMWDQDLLPYRELRAQIPFVMVAHATYPEVTDNQLPASLSRKWMQDVLRKKIGYRGLIISDDLEMGGVLSTGEIEDVAVKTLRAGADMFLVCHNQELVWRGYEAVLRTAERDRKFAAQIEQAARRVVSFKKRSKELRGFSAEPKPKVVEKLKRIVNDFSRIVDGGVIDDRLHTAREINA